MRDATFYTKVYTENKTGPQLNNLEIIQDHGIMIKHGNSCYVIDVDNYGRLVIQSIEDGQIIVKSHSANMISIESE